MPGQCGTGTRLISIVDFVLCLFRMLHSFCMRLLSIHINKPSLPTMLTTDCGVNTALRVALPCCFPLKNRGSAWSMVGRRVPIPWTTRLSPVSGYAPSPCWARCQLCLEWQRPAGFYVIWQGCLLFQNPSSTSRLGVLLGGVLHIHLVKSHAL